MPSARNTNIAPWLLLVSCTLEGLFPVIAARAPSIFPPVFFVGICAGIAAVVIFVYLLLSGELWKPIPGIALLLCFGLTVFNVLSFALIFMGAGKSTGINTALLLQAEMLFTFAVSSLLLRERLRFSQLAGAFAILAGTILVLLHDGSLTLNRWEFLIVFATALFPFGNLCAQKAMRLISPAHVLFVRYVFGAALLLTLSWIFERSGFATIAFTSEGMTLMLGYSILVLVFSKIFWFSGLRDMPLGRAVYMISATPVFSILFAFLILGEVPVAYQIGGAGLAIFGILLLHRPEKVSPMRKYPV